MAGPDPENLAQALGGLAPKTKTKTPVYSVGSWLRIRPTTVRAEVSGCTSGFWRSVPWSPDLPESH